MNQRPAGGTRKRAVGPGGMKLVGGLVAVATALLGILFWPLWILTAVSVAYLIFGGAAEKK